MARNSGHFRDPSFGRGWEEAGGEFYQEGFQNSLSSADNGSHVEWATMLPSKQFNVIDTKTWGRSAGRTYRRGTATKTRNRRNSSGDIELEETLPDLADGLANEEETWNQLQEIRSLPVNMATKRELKAKLLHAPTFRVHGMAALKLKRRQVWGRCRRNAGEFLSAFVPWQSSLRYIEASFGTGTASYFLLNRWMFLLNLYLSALVICFVILPWEIGKWQCLSNETDFTLSETCQRNSSRVNNTLWLNYTDQVTDVVEDHQNDVLKILLDAVQGTGWLELTLAFYGYYQPAILDWTGVGYFNLGLSYILTVVGVLLLSLILMTRSAAYGFRKNLSLGKSWVHRYSELVFASWDFCIDSASVAVLKKKAILQGLRAALANERFAEERASRTTRTKVRLVFIRLLINAIVVGVWALCVYIIVQVTTKPPLASTNDDDFLRLVDDYLPSITITLLNFVVPILFQFLMRWERYSATFEIKISLIRTVFLKLASLLVLIVTLFVELSKNGALTTRTDSNSPSREHCWETYIGQQLYRLCIFDIFVTVCNTFLVRFPISLVFRRIISGNGTKYLQFLARPEFDITVNTLDLIYAQAICWLGIFYSPVLSIATTAKLFLVYYVKYFSLNYYSVPPSRVFGAARSTYSFMVCLFVSFFICALPFAYAVLYLRPSEACGTFQGFRVAWDVVSSEISSLNSVVKDVIYFLGTGAFLVPAIIVLLVLLYYYKAEAAAQKDLGNALKQQLILEGQDKQFLLSRLLSLGNKHK